MIIQATWAGSGVPIPLLASGTHHPVDRPGMHPPLSTLLFRALLAASPLSLEAVRVGLASHVMGEPSPLGGYPSQHQRLAR